MFKRLRRIISAFTAAFILFSSTVCIPVDMSVQDTVSKAAIAAPEEETGEIFAPEEGAGEGAAGEDILAPEGADEGGVGEDTAGAEGYTDGSTGDVKADELTAPEAGDEGSAGEDDAEDAEVSEDTEETDEDTKEKTRTGVNIVTPDDIKPGDLIKKNTFINMYGYDSYTLVIDDCVIEEYEGPGEGLGEESDEDYGELEGESDEEYIGFTLSDNVLVVEPVEREPDTIYLETIYRGRHVLTETVFKTLLSMGEDMTLGGDTVLTEPLVIEDGATHTIDLNGNDIFLDEESTAKGSVITLKAGSKLILKDSGSGDPGEIRGGDSDHGAGISVEASSSLEMTGGAITKNEANQGAGLYIADGASASLDGVTVSLNNVKSADDLHRGKLGGGIYVAPGAQCTLSGCTIESNYANNGGGIYNLGTLQLTDVTVASNTAANDAGGIYTEGGAVIDDSRIISNTAANDGGGIYNTNNIVMTDTEVSSNSVKQCGGGIYVDYKTDNGKTVCSGGSSVTQNSAGFGGGVFIAAGAASKEDYKFVFGRPHDNSVAQIGSKGDYINSFSGMGISQNHAVEFGGGMFLEGNLPEVKLDGVTMENNFCDYQGGGIYTESPVLITDSSLRLNSAKDRGGAVFADYRFYKDGVSMTVTNSTVSENTTYCNSGAGIWIDKNKKTRFILGGGKTVIAMNSSIEKIASATDSDISNIGADSFMKIRIRGRFEKGSLISVAYDDASDKKVITDGYAEYNDKPIDTYFEYAGKDYIIYQDDMMREVTLKKKLVPSASGYSVKVQVTVTNDADWWYDAHVEFWGKRNNGTGEELCKYSTEEMSSYIDHGGGVWEGTVDYGDIFPSRINVWANFGAGGIYRGWEADVKVWVNGVYCESSHIVRKLWGNTVDKGKAANWINIGGDKFPYPADLEIVKKREIDTLNEASKEVEIICVDQYGVKYQPPAGDSFEMVNLSFPGEDTSKCLDKNGNKWKFDTSKKDECHNSVYKLSIKSGSKLNPRMEILIPVRFKVPLRARVMLMQEDGKTYKELYIKEGYQNDVIDITGFEPPVGYRIKSVKKDGVCDLRQEDDIYKMTFFTQNVVLKFETDQIKYGIEYDRNADNSLVTGKITYKTHKYNDAVLIAANNFKHRSGYTFSEWNTEPDGSGKSYAPGEEVSKLSTVNGDRVKLYAQWKDKDGNLVTASLFSDGKMGLKAGAVIFIVLILLAGARISVMKSKVR